MGHRLHIPRDGAKVGALRADDPRARLARVQIDEGQGFVDVTRGYGVTKQILIAAHDIEGWIAVIDPKTNLITQVRGDVKITFEPSTEARTS